MSPIYNKAPSNENVSNVKQKRLKVVLGTVRVDAMKGKHYKYRDTYNMCVLVVRYGRTYSILFGH